jgi:hypothetical protein
MPIYNGPTECGDPLCRKIHPTPADAMRCYDSHAVRVTDESEPDDTITCRCGSAECEYCQGNGL